MLKTSMTRISLVMSLAFAGASLPAAAAAPDRFEDLVVFGDSLSDIGNFMRFTYNRGEIYNEYLANYYGSVYSYPDNPPGNILLVSATNWRPRNITGPNYAQGGATANQDLGLAGEAGTIGSWFKFNTGKQVGYFLDDVKKNRRTADDKKIIFWVGGNDLRLGYRTLDRNNPSYNPTIDKSIRSVKNDLSRLVDAGGQFFIVPNTPNIAKTPSFILEFFNTRKVNVPGWGEWRLNQWWTSENDFSRMIDDLKMDGLSAREAINRAIEKTVYGYYQKKGTRIPSNIAAQVKAYQDAFAGEVKATTELVKHYNQGVDKALEDLQKQHPKLSIVRPDIEGMLDYVIDHYQEFGFNNVAGAANKAFSGAAALQLGLGRYEVGAFEPTDPRHRSDGKTDKPHLWYKNLRFLFADPFHPSPKVHRMVHDYLHTYLESESGDPKDPMLKSSSTTPFESNEYDIYYDGRHLAYLTADGNRQHFYDQHLKHDGRAFIAQNGGEILADNFKITTKGRVGSVMDARLGGKIELSRGTIDIERTNPFAPPLGLVVNGEGSVGKLDKVTLKTHGKEATAISAGRHAKVELVNKSRVEADGTGANAVNLWDVALTIDHSDVVSHNSNGVRVFANSPDPRENISYVKGTAGSLKGGDYAIRVKPNATGLPAQLVASFDSFKIDGAIGTDEGSNSNIALRNNTTWTTPKNSEINQLLLDNSHVNLATDENEANWQPKTLTVRDDFIGDPQSTVTLGAVLAGDDAARDMLHLQGNVRNTSRLVVKNERHGTGSETKVGIKLIDIDPQKQDVTIADKAFQLDNEVIAGIYQYTLVKGENATGADDSRDYYLTSAVQNNRPLVLNNTSTLASHSSMLAANTSHIEGSTKRRHRVLADEDAAAQTLNETPAVQVVKLRAPETSSEHENLKAHAEPVSDDAMSDEAASENVATENAATETPMADTAAKFETAPAESTTTAKSEESAAEAQPTAEPGPVKSDVQPAETTESGTKSDADIVQRIYSPAATVYASMPFWAEEVASLHLEHVKRTPYVPVAPSENGPIWVNIHHRNDASKARGFINVKSNHTILSLGVDLINENNTVAGVAAVYTRSTNKLSNRVQKALGMNDVAGDIKTSAASLGAYMSHYLGEHTYVEASGSLGRAGNVYTPRLSEKALKNHTLQAGISLNAGYRAALGLHGRIDAHAGLEDVYYRAQATDDGNIKVGSIKGHIPRVQAGVDANWTFDAFHLTGAVTLEKALKKPVAVQLNGVAVADETAQSRIKARAAASYQVLSNVLVYTSLEYGRSLPGDTKWRNVNAQVGLNMTF